MSIPFLDTIETSVASGEPHRTLNDGTGQTSEYMGSGSPEGVITAGPGSRFTDRTNGFEYVKKSGTGNTGWLTILAGEPYATANTVALRDSTYPVASQLEGFRVKVASNQIIYTVRDGAYVIEDYESQLSDTSAWGNMSDLVAGQKVYITSLRAAYLYNGTSWEQDGCCTVGTETTALITDDLPPPVSITAISSTATFAANVFTFGSSSVPTTGFTLNLIRWTLTFTDTGFPNDGRVIVIEATSDGGAVSVASDTGGTPAARLDTAELTGNENSFTFTADANNDIVLSGGGSINVDLLAQDTSAATNTATNIL